MNLPILTCSYCMRKVGLWNFHQIEETGGDGDALPNTVSTSAQETVSASAGTQEVQGDFSVSPTTATTPSRMKLRSQDSTRSDQASKNYKKGCISGFYFTAICLIFTSRMCITGRLQFFPSDFACPKQRFNQSQRRAAKSQRKETCNPQ